MLNQLNRLSIKDVTSTAGEKRGSGHGTTYYWLVPLGVNPVVIQRQPAQPTVDLLIQYVVCVHRGTNSVCLVRSSCQPALVKESQFCYPPLVDLDDDMVEHTRHTELVPILPSPHGRSIYPQF